MLEWLDWSDYIFTQERIGKDGKPFTMYKIRTMADGASYNGNSNSMRDPNDPRITKIGRFMRKYWVDELPQLWNIMKGDMALVGARPLTREAHERLPEALQKERINYKPGLISQLYADDIRTWQDRIESERKYLGLKATNDPNMIDTIYFFRFLGNVVFRGARGV